MSRAAGVSGHQRLNREKTTDRFTVLPPLSGIWLKMIRLV